MSHDNLTYEDLLQIVELIKSSEQFSEFRLKVGDIEVELRRRRGGEAAAIVSDPVGRTTATDSGSAVSRAPGEAPAAEAAASTQPPSTTPVRVSPPALPSGSIVVRAPMVGTFYRSPAPGAPPFVSEGQMVEADTTVCIIEVMKLMNSIPAGARGRVHQVLVADGAAVATGAPLIVLDPQ